MTKRLLEKFMDDNRMHNFEGQRGVINLCKIARALGYQDPMRYGQLESGAYLGDLTEMLSDNSGLIETMVNWIQQNERCWADQLVDLVECEDEDEEDEE